MEKLAKKFARYWVGKKWKSNNTVELIRLNPYFVFLKVVNSKTGLSSSQEKADNESVELVGDHGCLSAVLELLNDLSDKGDEKELQTYELHVALVSKKNLI